jgi:very-short-patch-repair endonuclease
LGDGGFSAPTTQPSYTEITTERPKRNRANRDFARKLRREMSISEKVMWQHLRRKGLGFSFRRQYPVGRYVLDFYCPEARLCVEIDGEQHDARQCRDAARDAWLLEQGVLTLRLSSLELFDHDTVVDAKFLGEIRRACEERSGRKDFEAGG